jgi:hypothetical protein
MIVKTPILPKRVRKVPKSFSWIDHRLARDRHIERLSHAAMALYLFLVCVGDRQGLSYYGDQSLANKLNMKGADLDQARSELIAADLVAWQRPIYQVLGLDPAPAPKRPSKDAMRLGDILKQAMEAAHD